jgi:circadian clock protein KaiB
MRRFEPSAVSAWTAGGVAEGDGETAREPARNDNLSGQPVSGLFEPALRDCRVVRQSDGGRGEFAGRLRSLPAETPGHRDETSTTDGLDAPEMYRLLLLVAGSHGRSRQAVENLRLICNEHLAGRVELQIIDIHQNPELAQTYQVIAVPTLLKLAPEPKRIIGDLSDRQRVLDGLDLNSPTPAQSRD